LHFVFVFRAVEKRRLEKKSGLTSLVSGIFLNVFIQKMEFEAPICGEWKIAFSQTIFYSQQKNEAKRAEMTDRISSLLAFLTYGLLNGTPSSFLFQLQNAELLSFCKGKDEVL
jgi:hypothetical protein